ncbi:hypothetical protein [Fibrobacter succinogenes]|uniref:hypothetical protein n=1 Tax=Fibrobacter succinogenes TaxID=833 RepID=UPI001563CEDC|nr:hypothetical protein [Fibrobacter succinogenes]
MRFLRIQIFITIALLAACKSTDPTSKKLLAEHVSHPESSSASLLTTKECTAKDSVEQLENMIKNAFSPFKVMFPETDHFAAFCEVQKSKDTLLLGVLTIYVNIDLSITITNGTATFLESIYFNSSKKEPSDSITFEKIYTHHKQDSTKFNLKRSNDIITYTFLNANCIDLDELFTELHKECPRRMHHIIGDPGPNHNFDPNLGFDLEKLD